MAAMSRSTSPGGRRGSRRVQLNEEAASYVRDLILSRRLPADALVPVEQVAEALDISATPVREALVTLRAEGFLRLEPRRGFVVAPLRSDDLHDLWQVHAYLAGELAARAAQRISPEVLTDARRLQDQMRDSRSRQAFAEVEELNFAVHRIINRSAEAPKLLWFLRLAMKYVPARFVGDIAGWADASIDDHVEVLDALEARDSDHARQAMRDHVTHAEKLFVAHHDEASHADGNAPNTSSE